MAQAATPQIQTHTPAPAPTPPVTAPQTAPRPGSVFTDFASI